MESRTGKFRTAREVAATSDAQREMQQFLASAHVFATAVRDVMDPKLLQSIAGASLNASQLKIMQLLSVIGTQIVGEVAAFLGVSNAAASKAVDKLVRQKRVYRVEEHADRRASHLFITGSGRRLLERYEEARAEQLTKILRSLPENDVRLGMGLLNRLAAAIVNHTESSEEVCLQCGIYNPETCLIRLAAGRQCSYLSYCDRNARRVPRK